VNILFLALDVDLARRRGDSVHVRELSAHLAELGHSVRLVTATRTETEPERIVHIRRRGSGLGQVAQAVALAHSWADVVYERRMSPKISWAVSTLTGIPFVVEANGVLEDEIPALRSVATDSRGSLRTRLRGRFLRASSRIVAVSRGVRDDLVGRFRIPTKKIEIVPNGANTRVFRPLDRRSCRSELSVPVDARVACFVGNVVPWQGVDVLVRAAALLKSEEPKLITLVVGDGASIDDTRSLAARHQVADRVRFVGAVDYEDVPRFINAADICVAPFRKSRKASPIKIFEYLACEKPVVTSDVDDIGDFVRSCGAGVVIEPEDDRALADALRWLLLHPEDATIMGRSGRKAVLERRSWVQTSKRVSEILATAGQGTTAS